MALQSGGGRINSHFEAALAYRTPRHLSGGPLVPAQMKPILLLTATVAVVCAVIPVLLLSL